MRDIAAELKVSAVTVSKVLRNQGRISSQMRQKVLQRARELNYRPNPTARSLATGRTFLIGMIVPDLIHPFFAAIAKQLTRNLRQRDYSVVLSSTDEDPVLELQEVQALIARRVDGLILASSQHARASAIARCLRQAKIPCLLLDRPLRGMNAVSFVGSDNQAIGMLATEHLIRQGYRRIAHVGVPTLPPGADRLNGYRAALQRHGHRLAPNRMVAAESGDAHGEECGYAAMQKLLRVRPRPDAVFCYNDILAAGAERAVLDAALEIPDDIALIGVSNLAGLSCWNSQPVPLSSIDQDVDRIASEASAQLLALLEVPAGASGKRALVPPRLVIRESTYRVPDRSGGAERAIP